MLCDLWQVFHALLYHNVVSTLADVVLIVLDEVVAVVVPPLVPLVLPVLGDAQRHQVLG